jgi:hypothetical protein
MQEAAEVQMDVSARQERTRSARVGAGETWTLAREEADLRRKKLKWNAVIMMHELGCCEAQGGSKGGLTRRLARGELASMQFKTGIRFELTDGPSQESQRRRQGQGPRVQHKADAKACNEVYYERLELN